MNLKKIGSVLLGIVALSSNSWSKGCLEPQIEQNYYGDPVVYSDYSYHCDSFETAGFETYDEAKNASIQAFWNDLDADYQQYLSTTSTDHWCDYTHDNFNKLSGVSGCLKYPILFVHGIGDDKHLWGMKNEIGRNRLDSAVAARELMEYFGSYHLKGYYDYPYDYFFPDSMGYEFFDGTSISLDEVSDEPGNIKNDVTHQIKQVYDKMEEVLDFYYGSMWRTDTSMKIDLVSHSQGALVVRTLLADDDYRNSNIANPLNHINSIISLNSPHLGSSLATFNNDYAALNGFRNDVDYLIDNGYFDMFPAVGKIFENMIKFSGHFDMNSNFLAELNAQPYPNLPMNNEKIPMVAAYSTAPELGQHLLDIAREKSEEACKIDIVIKDYELNKKCENWRWGTQWICKAGVATAEAAVNLYIDAADFTSDLGISFTTSVARGKPVYYTKEDVASWACNESAEHILGFLDHEYMNDLDATWFNESDGVVDVFSQKGEGVFDESVDPFVTLNLNEVTQVEAIPHLKTFDYLGPENFGDGLIRAFEIIPTKRKVNIVPTIITPLLLN